MFSVLPPEDNGYQFKSKIIATLTMERVCYDLVAAQSRKLELQENRAVCVSDLDPGYRFFDSDEDCL